MRIGLHCLHLKWTGKGVARASGGQKRKPSDHDLDVAHIKDKAQLERSKRREAWVSHNKFDPFIRKKAKNRAEALSRSGGSLAIPDHGKL